MKWLIDLIIASIGVPPCYVDRGDPNTWDFDIDDITRDGAWHELDLSGIVPAEAQAVLIRLSIKANAAAKAVYLREKGNTGGYNRRVQHTQVANMFIERGCIVTLGANGIIEYLTSVGGWISINLLVAGWWL